MMSATPIGAHRPPLWLKLPTAAGNAVQLIGLAIGAALTYAATAAHWPAVVRIVLMMAGWVALLWSSHAIAHWGVGRLVGIQFRGYGIRGSDHPEIYPPRTRAFLAHVPFFVALTSKEHETICSNSEGAHVQRRRNVDNAVDPRCGLVCDA